jgi:hypothetical protein
MTAVSASRGNWRNVSKFHPLELPGQGAHVRLELDNKGFIRTLQVLDAAPSATSSSNRDSELGASKAYLGHLLQRRAIRTIVLRWRDGALPDVPCPRCQEATQLYTVPLKLLPAGEEPWQALCGECFRGVLNAEPTDQQLMKPVQHGPRSRRR